MISLVFAVILLQIETGVSLFSGQVELETVSTHFNKGPGAQLTCILFFQKISSYTPPTESFGFDLPPPPLPPWNFQ